jgi:co-chaperonin GroES (HSP10)
MRVLSKYILVSEIPAKQTTASSGLITTALAVENMRYHEATVVAPGSDVSSVIVGDIIVFDRAQGHNVTMGDKTYRIIQERDVAVVL